MSADPFTLGHDAIWTCLEASDAFTSLVAAINRIKFTGNARDPWDRIASCENFPAVTVVPSRGVSKLCADSDTTDVQKQFTIHVGGGSQSVSELFSVQFAILRAMANWRATIGAVTWNDKPCVLGCGVFEHPEQMDNQLVERGILGWSAAWSGYILFTFTTADLIQSTSSSSGA